MKEIRFEEFNSYGKNYAKRDCITDILYFIDKKDSSGKILALYGLRRTGKSTLLEQALIDCSFEPSQCIFFEMQNNDTMEIIFDVLEKERKNGKKVFVFDEITKVSDFIDNSSCLADIYSKYGLKIIIAGTDSLGIEYASQHELFDRIDFISTTYIPFAEHSKVIGTKDIDDYIQFGGLMRKELNSTFIHDEMSAKRYLDDAVSQNISSSIKKNSQLNWNSYEIQKLSQEELTCIIEKLIELYSGKFNQKVIQNELKRASVNYPFKKNKFDIAEDIFISISKNSKKITEEFVKTINAEKIIKTEITEKMVEELTSLFRSLNILSVTEQRKFLKLNENEDWTVTKDFNYYIVQPTLKYNYLKKAIDFIQNTKFFENLSEYQKNSSIHSLENKIKGDMTEQIVLFDTQNILGRNFKVLKPTFEIKKSDLSHDSINGEYDMLVYNAEENCYWCFEIKHDNKISEKYKENGEYDGYDKHLVNPLFKEEVDRMFGIRKKACILYNGKPYRTKKGILCLNTSLFLRKLTELKNIEKTIKYLESKLCIEHSSLSY